MEVDFSQRRYIKLAIRAFSSWLAIILFVFLPEERGVWQEVSQMNIYQTFSVILIDSKFVHPIWAAETLKFILDNFLIFLYVFSNL